MKISIITVVWNNEKTIRDAINSVLAQTYKNIEYIIIDGNSSDGTVDLIKTYGNKISKFVSEDDCGLYDAMNKGIDMASGDVIGILNSDDYYVNNNVIEQVVNEFDNRNIESVFADLVYVSPKNLNKTIRYFNSGDFKLSLFAYGLMPAHPTFFVKKNIYEKYGKYRTDMKNAADFDLLVRFLYVNKVTYSYISKAIVVMRIGGASTSFSSIWTNNVEIMYACKVNGIKTNIFKVLLRYMWKFSSLFKRVNL